jgi:hypothetical protein
MAFFGFMLLLSVIGGGLSIFLFPNHYITAAIIWGVFIGLAYRPMVWEPFLARFFEKGKREE